MALIHSAHLGVQPLFMQSLAGEAPINYSAAEFRQLITSIWPTDGITGPTSFHLTQADTVGWSVQVSSGVAKLGGLGAGTTSAGGYLVVNPAAVTINLTGIQTNPIALMTHAVFLTVQDKTVYGDGYYAEIVVSTDEGAGWAVPDAAASLLLGVIRVSPGQSNIQNANITAKPANASHGGAFLKLADTGVLASGIVSADTLVADYGIARARYAAGKVTLTGAIMRTASAPFKSETTYNVGTMPYYLTPNNPVWIGNATSGPYPWRLRILTTGLMQAFMPYPAPNKSGDTSLEVGALLLDGMSYEVD